jgi:iron complex outermembrane recepter protein
MSRFAISRRASLLAALCGALPCVAAAQQPDTTRHVADSLNVYTLPPAVVSVTRANPPINRIPQAVQLVEKAQISRARPTWGLDEALVSVPGVYAANRYNFSLDQRISIRGFGARSAFAVRGIKVLVDGIPQTLPDGQGQLTNLELGAADRIEVLRGSSSALFGNASGGVISIWTDPTAPETVKQDVRVLFGTFDRDLNRNWSKWQSSTSFRVGSGSALVTVSRLDYTGQRQHSDADFRNLNSRWHFPLANGWSLAATADVGWDPRADNPGALTAAEMAKNPDSAAARNITLVAGKDVTQGQGGVTLRRAFAGGGEASLTVFGIARSLKNPTTFAYIDLDRIDYGTRLSVSHPLPLGSLEHRLTAGLDFQRQRDDRLNYGNNAGQPDTVRSLDQLEHVTEVGPFVQSALLLTPHVSVTGGLRYDWVNFQVDDRLITATNPDDSGRRLMQALSGSVGVAVTPSDAVTVYGNVGTSFETPTTTELTNRPNAAGGFNPSLEPQKATNYEVGLRGDWHGRLSYSLALFQANVRDQLIPFPDTLQRVYFQNAGRSIHRGVEVGVDLTVAAGLNLVGAYTFADYRYDEFRIISVNNTVPPPDTTIHDLHDRALPGIPKHWLHVTLQARPAWARNLWAEIEETHSSSFFVDDTLSMRTSPWWTTNVRLGWDGNVGSVRFHPFVGFNNVFNRQYVSSVAINAQPIRVGSNFVPGRYYEPAPGRNMYIGFSVGAGE